MAKLIIDLSSIGGVAPFHGGNPAAESVQDDPHLRYLGGETQYASGFMQLGKPGYLVPSNRTLTNITANPSAPIGSTEVDDVNTRAYFWERGTKLHELDTTVDTTLDVNRTVSGATGTDLAIYQVNEQRRLFYSYQKSGGGDIGIWDFSSTYDDTWLSATCASGFNTGATNEVKMIIADNGFMYVLDGNYVHKIDGTSSGGSGGTASANVLSFPPFFQLKDGVDTRGTMWIALLGSSRTVDPSIDTNTSFNSLCGVYVWDRQTTVVDMTDFIPISGVRDILMVFSFRGGVWCFTHSGTYNTQLRAYNGSSFEVVEEFAGNAYPTYHDSLFVSGDMFHWLGRNGEFYSYGKVHPSFNDALYKTGRLNAGNSDVDNIDYGGGSYSHGGAVAHFGGGSLHYPIVVNLVGTSASVIRRWSMFALGSAFDPSQSDYFSLVKFLPKLSTVKSVTLRYPTSATTGTTKILDMDIYLNNSSTSWGTTAMNRTDGTRGYKYVPVGEPNVNAIQLGFKWNNQNDLSPDNQIFPYLAEVEYEPKTKKK